MNNYELKRIELLTVAEKLKLSFFPFLGSLIVFVLIQFNSSMLVWALTLAIIRGFVQFIYVWGEKSLQDIRNINKVEQVYRISSIFMGGCWAISPFLFINSYKFDNPLIIIGVYGGLITIISAYCIMSLPRIDFFILFLTPLLLRAYYQLYEYHLQGITIVGLFLGLNLFAITQIVFSFKLKKIYINQIGLKIVNEELVSSLSKSQDELEKMVSLYKSRSLHDELTSLPNRRYLMDTFYEFKLSSESTSKYALMVIDLDYFKRVNDQYGHQAGDLVLREIGNLLRNNVRKDDVVSRVGGEEFVIMLPNIEENELLLLAERIRKLVEKYQFYLKENTKFSVTISIGLSLNTLDLGIEESFNLADQAVYEAKRSGRNQVSYYNNINRRLNFNQISLMESELLPN